MSHNPNDPEPGSGRISPDELAQRVARHLRRDEPAPRRRHFDIVRLSRIAAVIGLLLLGVGVAMAVPWVGRLTGYETPGVVVAAAPITGCPGEQPISRLIQGDTVQVVGVTQDGRFLALRDGRGPGNVVYVEAGAVADVAELERLPMRDCQPAEASEIIMAGPGTTAPAPVSTTTVAGTVTTAGQAAEPTTTTPGAVTGRPPRRGAPSPGVTTGTTAPTTPSVPSGPGSPPTTRPPGSTTTTRPPSTTTTTRPPSTTTTTAAPTTTSTAPTTTTTEATTTTSEATTTTTEPATTTIP